MKAHIALLTGVSMAMSAAAQSQHENWDTYMARYGAKPGSVMVDMGLMQSAPDKLLPYLVVTGPHAKNCPGNQGIPDTGEIFRLEGILDVTGGILSGATAKKLAGTFTYNCERLNYYYVRDTTAVRNALTRMYANHYRDYNYTLKIKHEPLWLTYRTFLYPDSIASAWIRNNKAMLSMLQTGDGLREPRAIQHTLYFSADTARKAFAAYATTHRYSVAGTFDAPGTALPYEITVARQGQVIMDSIMAMESELSVAAKTWRGVYKYWEAPIKK